MSMDKRGDTWRFRVKYKNQIYTMNFKGTDKEAKKAHDTFKIDVQNERIGITTKMNMNQLCELVYTEYVKTNCRVGTQRGYRNAYNTYILPELGLMQIIDIKPVHIQKLANKLGTHLKPNTISGILACLSKTLSLAEQWELIERTPYRHIEYKRPTTNVNAELLPTSEIKRLISYYQLEETNLMHKTAFYLAIGCGLRNSEIRALTLADIDFELGIISIDKQIAEIEKEPGVIVEGPTPPKTPSSIRKIYAPQFVLDTLKSYISTLPYVPITKQIFWSHITRKPITKHCLSKRFTSIVRQLDITPIRFHDLRHLQATLLINTGVNVKSISKRMGHSKTDITLDVYAHSLDSVDKQIASHLDSTFENIHSLL